VRRATFIALGLSILGVATRIGDAGAPLWPERVAEHAPSASAAASHAVGSASAPAALSPEEMRALAAAWSERVRVQQQERRAAPQRAHAAPPLGATRLALLEQRGPVRRVGAPLRVAGVDHTRFEVTKRGLPFLDRGGRIHERDGQPIGVSGRTQFPPLALRPRTLDRTSAIERAKSATGVQALLVPPRTRLGWVARDGRSVLALEVTLVSRSPLADYRVWLDAADGAVLGKVDRLLSADGTGVVFAKDPLTSKTPGAQPLRELDGSGRLIGRIAAVFDEVATEAFRPDLLFEFPTADPRFRQTSVYRGLTEAGLLAELHGFPTTAPVPAFTGLLDPFTGGPLNNAYYVPSIPAFGFGDGDGVVLRNLGTDIDVSAHEFGHHVFEILAEPLVNTNFDPVLAMHEGVADTFSLLIGGDTRVGNSTVPGAKALRTIGGARFPGAFDPDPHVTGLVYAGANADLVDELGAGPFMELLVASLPFLPPEPVETDYREAFLDGDLAANAGVNQALLAEVFHARGFDDTDLPATFQGEIVEGMPEMGTIPADDYQVWIFSELPPSGQLRFQTTGTGDVDLVVVPIDFDDTTPLLESFGPGSAETVNVSASTLPSIHDADTWLVFVFDAFTPGGSTYTLTATATPGADDISIGGGPVAGSIVDPHLEIDWFQFQATAGQRVRVAMTGTGGTIDPFVAVVTREPFEVLETDDDSGGGTAGLDALLQGVLIPTTGKYVVAALSVASDFDPSVGAGFYTIELTTCNNSGADFDGDGVADLCDQDDDDDGFGDDEDLDDFDVGVCIDADADGCNDCASGEFDFLDDGLDSDNDSACDLGDEDDDNDGCADDVDPAPLVPSVDDDLDFLGLDCDNCAEVPNPAQEDADDDGDGDACSVCTRVAWQEPPTTPPDQNPAGATLQLSAKGPLGSLRARGAFNPAGAVAPLDPSASGVQVRLADGSGALLDVFVPPTAAGLPCGSGDGWNAKGASFSYANRSGALPPLCVAGSAQGLSSVRITDERAVGGAVLYSLGGKGVPLPQGLAAPVRFLQLDLALGEPPAPGVPSPEGAAGVCAESLLRVGAAGTACRISQKDGVVRSVRCALE
jgi:Thermolysin metallopeptidase, catalytic domain